MEVISSGNAPELFLEDSRVPLKEDITINDVWHGTVWSNQEGWHNLILQDSTQLNFYISSKNEWSSLNLSNQAGRNLTYSSSAKSVESAVVKYHRVSPLLFFLVFLLASGTLWLLAKI